MRVAHGGLSAGCHEVSRRVLHGRGAAGFFRRLRSGVGASDERCLARKARHGCKLSAHDGAIGAAGDKCYGFRASRAAGCPAGCHEVSRRVLHGRGAAGFFRRLHSGVGASEERCPAREARRGCKLSTRRERDWHGRRCFIRASFTKLPARGERVCKRQGLWFSRVARGGLSAGCHEVSRRVLHGRGATGFSQRLRSGVGASEAPLCREGKRAGPECVWKRKKPAMAGDVPPVSAKHAQASWRKVQNLQRHNGAKNAEIAIQESFKHTPARP